jgi:hypothetical protein
MSSNFNNAKIINVYYNKGDRKPYDVNGKPIAYIGEEFIGANEATEIRFFFGEELDSASAIIVAKRANNDTRLDPLELVGTGVNAYFKIRLNAWYAEYKGKMTIIFKVYNGTVTYDDAENPTQITATTGQIIVSDIFNLEVAYAPNASSLVPPFETEDYDDWFFTLSTKLDKAQSITVTGALPSLAGAVYNDRYFYVEDEGVGRLYYIDGSTAIEVVWQVGTLKLSATGGAEVTTNTGKVSFDTTYGGFKYTQIRDVVGYIGQDVEYYGKAVGTIAKGDVIQFDGVDGVHFLIKKAVPSDVNANPEIILGIAKQGLTNGQFGYVLHFGRITNINLTAYADENYLWFASASANNGELTITEPTAPNAKVLIGVVVDNGASGTLLVRPMIQPSLKDLKDIHITSIANNQVLRWNNANLRWENTSALTTAETDIDALEGRMTTEEGNVDNLQGRMTTAETDITNIENGTTIVGKALADQNGNVINTTYLTQSSATATYIPLSQKGQANGVTPLGSNGKVPSIYLSGEQDDLAEFANLASFPAVGETDILYVALDTNKLYRWSGSAYVVISETLAIGTTNTTAFAGDRGLALEGVVNTASQVDTGVVTWNASTGKFVSANNFIKTSGGNVGIGTASPVEKLHIDINSATKNYALIGNQNGGVGIGVQSTGIPTIFNYAAKGIVFAGNYNTALTEQMRIDSAGNVGIGTSSPNQQLEVKGAGLTLIKVSSAVNTSFRGMAFGIENNATMTGSVAMEVSGGELRVASGYATYGGFQTFYTNGTEKMRITSTGNVGIGTTAPALKLHVAGGTRITGVLEVRSDAETKRLVMDYDDANDTGAIFAIQDGVSYKNLTLNRDGGNVGIGTNSPISKLEVAGTISSNGKNLITSDGTSNYIFTQANLYIQSASGGSTLGVITSAGNVGIGTSSPATRLHILSADPILTIQDTETTATLANTRLRLAESTTGNALDNYVDLGLIGTNFQLFSKIGANEGTRLHIDGINGNVGIGTTAPATQLHISGTGGELLRLTDTNGITTSFTMYNGSSVSDSRNWGIATNGFNYGDLVFSSSTTNANDPSEVRFLVKSSGLVGINETAPSAQLQVKSGATNRIPLIVDSLTGQTADLQHWRVNGVQLAYIESTGHFRTPGIRNTVSLNNSQMSFDTTGAIISRNIADTNPALIVNLANASATGNIQVWQKAGSALATITNTGGATFAGLDVSGNTTLGSATFGINHSVTINSSTGGLGILSIKNSAATITGRGVGISFFSSSATAMGSLNVVTTDGTNLSKALLRLSSTESLVLNTNSADRMTIESTGNVVVDKLLNFAGTPSNEQTGDYTLVLTDKGKVLRINSDSDRIVTIPLNASVAFPIDTEIAILRYGTGNVDIAATAGVNLYSKNSEKAISGRYGSVALKKIATDDWVLVGSLEA